MPSQVSAPQVNTQRTSHSPKHTTSRQKQVTTDHHQHNTNEYDRPEPTSQQPASPPATSQPASQPTSQPAHQPLAHHPPAPPATPAVSHQPTKTNTGVKNKNIPHQSCRCRTLTSLSGKGVPCGCLPLQVSSRDPKMSCLG
ncbi:hypothetical protein Pcinc_014074 [Petrolisthes cinctipes]|uniref:Uncharacterized protein n=1 Tax=Petrolisthes cinctipes TaxID=88211 RepID=A0AAE1FYI9_PETCI|nr:hypothetical protein Pcinc_014074 [Petrolisthes cinctipes]